MSANRYLVPTALGSTFVNMVQSLTKPGYDILAALTPQDCHELHMAIGISGEAGELLDAIKRYTIYRKPMDRANIVEELGDIEFYLEGLRASLNISMEEVIQGNVDKLGKRYKAGNYSNAAAIAREDKIS